LEISKSIQNYDNNFVFSYKNGNADVRT